MRKAVFMKRLLLSSIIAIFAMANLWAQQSPDWYLNKPIRAIRFEGLQTVQTKDVEPIIKQYRNQMFTEDLWINLLSAVYGLDYFTDIMPEAQPGDPQNQSVIIVFKVVERPAVGRILLEGNRGLRNNELQEILSIKADSIFNQSDLRMDEIAIRRLYLEKGYPEIMVRSRHEIEDGRVVVIFSIDEGTRVTLDSVKFEGISALSVSALKGAMKLKERGLFQQGSFSEAQLQADRESIEYLYKTRGYLDATITEIQRELEQDEKVGARRLSLKFIISEGQRYTYDGVRFSGNRIFDTATLEAFFRMRPGSIFNLDRFLAARAQFEDLYYENGYIFNEISVEEHRDTDRGLISFTFFIVERDRAHIENIQVRGNTKTLEDVILREIPLEPGDIFSKTKVLDAMRNLYGLQFFSSVQPELLQGSQDLLMELVFNVQEQSTAEIQFGVTLSGLTRSGNSFPISGLLKWNEKNFMGRGQALNVDMNIAADTQSLSFGFTERWLFNRRWSSGIDLSFRHTTSFAMQDTVGPIFSYSDPARVPDPYSSMEEYLAAGKLVPSDYYMAYDTWSLSLGFNTGYVFKTRLGDIGMGGGYSISLNNKTYNPDLYRPFDKAIKENLNEWRPSNQLFGRVYYNKLDLWYDPSAGLYASQRLTLTGFSPNELERSIRSDTRIEAYATLINQPISFIPVLENYNYKLVFGAHSSMSWLLPWFDRQPAKENLKIDGTFLGRGWSGSQVSDKIGVALWSNWLELRWPIVPGVLSLDSFLDATALSGSSGKLFNIDGLINTTSGPVPESDGSLFLPKANNFAFSFGAGLRFTLQQFPFRLYFAKPFYFDSASQALKFVNPDKWEFVLSISQPLN